MKTGIAIFAIPTSLMKKRMKLLADGFNAQTVTVKCIDQLHHNCFVSNMTVRRIICVHYAFI